MCNIHGPPSKIMQTSIMSILSVCQNLKAILIEHQIF